MITIIAAMTRTGVIGRAGELPWRLPDEMRHFRRTTVGHTVVMGRRTFASIGRPLPGRETIVVSRTLPEREGVTVCRSLKDALKAGRGELFIAGGAEIYRQALPVTDRMLISYVAGDYDGDTVFPPVDFDAWEVAGRQRHADFEVVDYRRKGRAAAEPPLPARADTEQD